jgi:DNA-directed RNA polymerase specialized sigma24 family protein
LEEDNERNSRMDSDGPESGPSSEDSPPSESPEPRELPPELKSLPRAELALALKKARILVRRKSGSDQIADDLVPSTFLKMTTTRRWDPAKGSFVRHFLGAVQSELGNLWKKEARARERPVGDDSDLSDVEEGLLSAPSGECEIVSRADRLAKAERELRTLRERIAENPLLVRVLAKREEGVERAADIATALGEPVKDIYRANELLKYHLRKIREERGKGDA